MANYSNGVDISSYQGNLVVKNIPGSFVIVKATQGTGYTNPYMYSQVNQTLKAGKSLGLYHFANGGNWKAEADYFLRTAKPYLKKAILVLDYEGSAVSVGRESWAKNFLDYVAKKTGTKPMLYLGLSDENIYKWKAYGVNKYALWVAQYNTMATQYGYKPRVLYGNLRNWKDMTMFQYSPSGKLNGYGGLLDLDVYYGKSSDWIKHSRNDTGDNKEMSWSVKVSPSDWGGFLVTKKSGLAIYSEPNDDHRIGKKKLAYNTAWRVSKYQDGFVRVSKTTDKKGVVHEQWLDSTGGVLKGNPIDSPSYRHFTIFLANNGNKAAHAKLHKTPGGKPYGKLLPKGTKFHAESYDKKTGYFAVKDTKGKLVYVNGAKFLVLLGGNK